MYWNIYLYWDGEKKKLNWRCKHGGTKFNGEPNNEFIMIIHSMGVGNKIMNIILFEMKGSLKQKIGWKQRGIK